MSSCITCRFSITNSISVFYCQSCMNKCINCNNNKCDNMFYCNICLTILNNKKCIKCLKELNLYLIHCDLCYLNNK